MPEPALAIWIIGLPFIVAVVNLVRTAMSLKHTSSTKTGGAWSRALQIRR